MRIHVLLEIDLLVTQKGNDGGNSSSPLFRLTIGLRAYLRSSEFFPEKRTVKTKTCCRAREDYLPSSDANYRNRGEKTLTPTLSARERAIVAHILNVLRHITLWRDSLFGEIELRMSIGWSWREENENKQARGWHLEPDSDSS
jgi:hypothetical protein